MFYKQSNTQAGLTLIETLMVISIMTILSGVLFSSIFSLYRYNANAFAQAQEVNNARRGLNTLTRDLREMTYAEDGTFPVVRMENHFMSFYSDIDRDENVEYVEYELASTTLYKRTHNPTGNPPVYNFSTPDQIETLSVFVQNNLQATSTFTYFDTNGTQLTVGSLLTDVRYVRAQIIVNIDPIGSPGEFMLRTSVAPRNLKDNL